MTDADSMACSDPCKPKMDDVLPGWPPFTLDEMRQVIAEAELRYDSELHGRPVIRPRRPPAGSAGDLTDIGLISIMSKMLAQNVQTNTEAASKSTWCGAAPVPIADALRLILPLARGYAAAHPVGSNQDYVNAAEEALAAVRAMGVATSDDWQADGPESLNEAVKRVADAIQSVGSHAVFVRFNDWTEEAVPGMPVEICRLLDPEDDEIEVMARYPADAVGAEIVARLLAEEQAKAAIEAMKAPL